MANLEKLVKAFEALKVFQPGVSAEEAAKKKDQPVSKKDKITNCNVIADCICASSLRLVADFPKFLGVAMETFLVFTDDPESDVRMVADECLNKTIKTLLETNLGRLQVELYKEIKKNGPSRSLRAALWRFADMSHLIRPQKCRPYVVNMLPCISRICKRPEEAIQDTLDTAMQKLCPVLMGFTTDVEVKNLLKAFLPNLKSTSATARRTAGHALTLICQYTRKPTNFFAYLLESLLGMVLPVTEDMGSHVFLGVLLSLRHLLPHLYKQGEEDQSLKGSFGITKKEEEAKISTDQFIQIFELLLYCTGHKDHNVVTASLETLQQMLRAPPPQLINLLVNSGGMINSSIFTTLRRPKSESIMQRAPSQSDELSLEDDQESSEISTSGSGSTEGSGSSPSILADLDEEGEGQEGQGEAEATEKSVVDTNKASDDETDAVIVDEEVDPMDASYSSIEIGDITDEQSMSHSSSADTLADPKASPLHQSGKILKQASEDRLNANTEIDEEYIEPEPVPQTGPASVQTKMGDIGELGGDDPPILYCTRVICSRFLLTGFPEGLMPDRSVRVSVKALALSCLANSVRIYPKLLLDRLHREDHSQLLKDVLLFASHTDPQLKGNTAVLIGNFIHATLWEGGGKYEEEVKKYCKEQHIEPISLEHLVSLLLAVLEDDSSVAARLALLAFMSCLNSLLISSDCALGLQTLVKLLNVKNNSYWLVKVELLDILSDIDFRSVAYLESVCTQVRRGDQHCFGLLSVQEKVLEEVILSLLADEDSRVRRGAAVTLVKIVPKLFYPVDYPQQDPVISKAKELTENYLEPILHEWSQSPQPLVHGLVEPFHFNPHIGYCSSTEGSLSRVLAIITRALVESSSKYLTFGCCHALCLLSQEYLMTQYAEAWLCTTGYGNTGKESTSKSKSKSQSRNASTGSSTMGIDALGLGCGGGPLPLILSILTSSVVAMDISAHQDALQLAGNLFAGAAFQCLKWEDTSLPAGTPEDSKWTALQDKLLIPTVEGLLTHIARLLNIFTHIMEGNTPGPPPTKPSLPSLPNAPSLSPIKRKAKLKEESSGQGSQSSGGEKNTQKSGGRDKDKEPEKEKSKKEGLGTFYNLPHYMKLYDVLKGAYSNYMATLDLSTVDKFCSLLRTALDGLSQILEIAGLHEVGRYTEEFLSYLKVTFGLEARATVQCVQQLLKSLFGTNLASQWDSTQHAMSRRPNKTVRLATGMKPGLYHSSFTTPYTHFTQSLASATYKSTVKGDQEDTSSLLAWLKKRAERKIPAVLKPGSKTDKNSIASYIRLFEPLVIKALKQYTITSSLELQRQVLDLLAQLVQLRVNYCLLDSDQIFIGFVIKQFEFIEEGQIRNSETLIPHIFYFLVLLSYERYHSKSIIGMPKIIQLCDGIMASGQQPTTHAIPALQPIVYDLFVMRSNKADTGKDLDTQREVVVSMLLRLIQYYQVLELIIVVLHQCHKESEEKWKRLSRQVTDMVLPMLAKQQINLDSQMALDVLHRLFESVAASVFRPVDILLRSLFAPPFDLSTANCIQKWMCLVLAILRVLMSQSKEDVVLSRLGELNLMINIFTDTAQRHATGAPRSQSGNRYKSGTPPEETFARFLLQTIGLVGQDIAQSCYSLANGSISHNFMCQQLAHLLLYVMHMFQSGQFRKVATSAMALIKQDVPDHFYSVKQINAAFKRMASIYPTLTLQWCNILILLNYEDQTWWSDIMQTPQKYILASPSRRQTELPDTKPPASKCASTEIVRRGGLVLFCDYVCENLNDAEHMTWVIINHVSDLIELSYEPPVQDFISAIHRNAAASGLFIQAIHSRCDNLSKPTLVKRTLQCLEAIHFSQSGALLTLLIDKFLNTHHLACSRRCDTLACRRVEMLLAETPEMSSSQLPLEDLDSLLQFMKTSDLTRKHARLTSLLVKLRNNMCSEKTLSISPERSHPLAVTTLSMAKLPVDKMLYASITRDQCFSADADARECAIMLQKLDYSDILAVIMTKEFNLSVLEQCIVIGRAQTLKSFSQNKNNQHDSSSVHDSPEHGRLYDPLLKAAQLTLLRHINNVIMMLPAPHEIISYGEKQTPKEEQYLDKMDEFYTDASWMATVSNLTPALVEYLKTLKILSWKPNVPDEAVNDIARFSLLNIEIIHWLIHQDQLPSSEHLQACLQCFAAVLKNRQLADVIGQHDHVTWVCTSLRTVHQLISSMVVTPGESLVTLANQEIIQDSTPKHRYNGFHHVIRACDQMSELLHCLKTHLAADTVHTQLSPFLVESLRSIVIGLSRLSLVNSYARTPPLAWKLGWIPTPSGELKTKLPPLPLDYLQEKDILKDFIFRFNTTGWTSRQQFEETWMGLLGVLNPVAIGEEHHVSPEEEVDRSQCIVLALKGITALLVQSTLTPNSGNPCDSVFETRPRDKPLGFLHTRCGKRLSVVRSIIQSELKQLCLYGSDCASTPGMEAESLFSNNIEQQLGGEEFTLGQMSLESTWSAMGMLDFERSGEQDVTPDETRDRSSSLSGLDLHSCVQFLLDLYGQWLSPTANPRTALMVINQTIKSVVTISDLFTMKEQYEWMFDTLMEVHKAHPWEDELVGQYVVVGICKAAAVIGGDLPVSDVSKLIDSALKSAHIPTRVATLHGCLYLLEAGISDITKQFLPVVAEYLLKQLEAVSHVSTHNQQHMLLIWSTAFFIVENYQEIIRETEFTSKVLQLAISLASASEEMTPLPVYLAILQGLERLVLANVLFAKDSETLVKLSVDRICMPNPQRALAALGLMLTCMYAGKQSDAYTPTIVPDQPTFTEPLSEFPIPQDPESLIVAMERVTVLFDRIRKGFPFEARVLTLILPPFLLDFFPPQDIMNKVIGEFLSSQQPHPQLMASVVFEVFSSLNQKGQHGLVRDWVMLSLSNFTQRTPISMAVWSLTCCFISASTNGWLRALFHHVVGRMGKMEKIDRRFFCLAALDFSSQLTDEGQQRAFHSTFQSVARHDTPYADVMACFT